MFVTREEMNRHISEVNENTAAIAGTTDSLILAVEQLTIAVRLLCETSPEYNERLKAALEAWEADKKAKGENDG